MKNIKGKLFRIILASLVATSTYYFAAPSFFENSNVQAIGDLSVSWGVTEGSPIFVVNNMSPGQTEERDVLVTNNAPSTRPVGVRAIEVSQTNNLASVLEITISEGASDLYGGTLGAKTLTDFISESSGPNGVFLSEINSGNSKTYSFKVNFQQSAQNEFQNSEVIFDLKIGISIDLPQSCDEINLLPTPIIGTKKAEKLTGTPGNDLIIGLEGADDIRGMGGDDCILGGVGAEDIYGGTGNDVIFGEQSADTIYGGEGNDLLVGADAADTIKGEGGDDHIIGGLAADKLDGGEGNDLIEGNEVADNLTGGLGDDKLLGGPGIDRANGNIGYDQCEAESRSNCEVTL